jgi:hypothetical protein
MQSRIENAQGACQGCNGIDKVVVAALAQNKQISIGTISQLSRGAKGQGIAWNDYFKAPPTSKGQLDAQVREQLTGMKYKNLVLLKYIQDLKELNQEGWDLPDDINIDDLDDLEDLANSK